MGSGAAVGSGASPGLAEISCNASKELLPGLGARIPPRGSAAASEFTFGLWEGLMAHMDSAPAAPARRVPGARAAGHGA